MAILKRIATGVSITAGDPTNRRDILLSDINRIGYGAAATGGSNVVEVNNESQFWAAVGTTGNYLQLTSSMTGVTITRDSTFNTYANDLTIDASLASGFRFLVGGSFPTNGYIFRIHGDNIILHNFEGQGVDYPSNKANNSFINIYGQDIWIDKISGANFDDDFVNLLNACTNVTVSRCKTRNTNKSVFNWNPNAADKDTRVTVHSCDLSSEQRSPWLSAGRAHALCNWIHGGGEGSVAGRTFDQSDGYYNHNQIAEMIVEGNVFEGQTFHSIAAHTEANGNEGYIDSIDNDLSSGSGLSGTANINTVSSPQLFTIPYDYSAIKRSSSLVKAHVQSVAGST